MITTSRKQRVRQWPRVWPLLGLVALGLLIAQLLRGSTIALLMPKGLIAQDQLNLMKFSVGVMLAVAIPCLTLLYFVAWKYRESNNKSTYEAASQHSKLFMVGVWAVPTVVIGVLTATVLPATYHLDPHKPIAATTPAIPIQVIALRWKWLFIYPQQNVASVNFVQIPINVPVEFDLTADEAPMNSFWIPRLGGQLYAMTGHDNRLNLMATTAGDYAGHAAEINGAGFAGMQFTARASSRADFDQWVQNVKQTAPDVLDDDSYAKLLVPSQNNKPTFFAAADDDLYMNNDQNINNRVYGSEITNACDGIDVSGSTNLHVVGTSIHDLYDADGPDSSGGTNCHSDNIDDVQGKLANLSVDYSVLGRMEMEAHKGTITGLSITNSWITNSVGVGLHLANEGTTITGSINNTHFFSNAGADIQSDGSGSAQMNISNSTCQKAYSGCTTSSATPPASQNPVSIWKAAHPYTSWSNFLE